MRAVGCAILFSAIQSLHSNVYTFTARDGYTGSKVRAFAESTNGNVWVGTAEGLFEFDGRWIAHDEAGGPGRSALQALSVDRSGNIWAGGPEGIYRWDQTQWQAFPGVRMGWARMRLQPGLKCTPNGEVWVMGADRRVYCLRGQVWQSYGPEQGLPDDFGLALACDQRGQVWATFEQGDVARFDGRGWQVWRDPDRPWGQAQSGRMAYATSVAVDSRTNVWVGTWNGLFRYDGQSWQEFSPRTLVEPEGLCIQSITFDRRNRLWYASFSQGLLRLDGQQWRQLCTANDSLPNDFVAPVFADSRGHVWFGDRTGRLHRLAPDCETTPLRHYWQNLRLSAWRAAPDAAGGLWVETGYSWINTFVYNGAELRNYHPDGTFEAFSTSRTNLLTDGIRDLTVGPDGTLWLATACGLMRWEQDKFVPCSFRMGPELTLSDCAYRADAGDRGRKEEWFRSPGASEGWTPLHSPVWTKADHALVKSDSVGWYRLRFEAPPAAESWDLLCVAGQANDDHELYCNGALVGTARAEDRTEMANLVYIVPQKHMRPGVENLLHLRLQGFYGPTTGLKRPRLIPVKGFLKTLDLTALHLDREGQAWVSTRTGGFARYDGHFWAELPLTLPELADDLLVPPALHVDRRGALWVGTSNTLYVLPREAKAAVEVTDLPEARGRFPRLKCVSAIEEDQAGALWFAADAGLGKWAGSSWTLHPWPFKGHERMRMRLALDARGRLWVGTCCDGLFCFDGRHWSVSDMYRGLGSKGIYDLLVDGAKGIWVASQTAGLSYYLFDLAPPHVQLAAYATQVGSAGKVVFTWDGWDQWLQTPREDLRYFWRLDNGPWSAPQASTYVFLDSLKPGAHQFAVKASDRDLNESEASLAAFSVAWPVWKQGWFLGLVGGLALLALLSAAFARSRHQRLKVACADLGGSTVALEKANAKLRELDQLKTQFLSNVSHELRTPLTSIKGSADNLLDGIVGQLSPPQREYVELICAATHRLIPFVDDLLDLSRIENGRIELARQPVQVDRVLEQTVKGLQPLASEQQVTLRLERPVSSLLVRADADRVSQVIINLVCNALRYTPAGGMVTVSAEQADSAFARISVTDTGPGIPEDEQSRIFEKFYQVQGQALPRHHGAGLGLSIAKGIVEAHGGVIGVKNNPGGGSVFWFTLPLVANGAITPGQEGN
jgi:signal transduction histidine kinase/ligand-binding sensor domain-containing protein